MQENQEMTSFSGNNQTRPYCELGESYAKLKYIEGMCSSGNSSSIGQLLWSVESG